MSKLDSSFYNNLIALSNRVGMKPEDILNVMAVESGLDPSAHNKNGNASGLVQMMPKTLKNLGFKGTHEDFRKIDGSEQLKYVEKLINNMSKINGGPLTSAVQYYIGNFLPVALMLPGVKQNNPNTIIVAKNPNEPHLPHVTIEKEKIFYDANQGLDFDKDGKITLGDIQKVISRARNKQSFKDAISQLSKINNATPIKNNQNIDDLLNKYLTLIAGDSMTSKKQYHNTVIKVIGKSFNDSVEFARILVLALDEELKAKVSIHTLQNEVEVDCWIPKDSEKIINATSQLINLLKDTFFETTKKIGGVRIETNFFINKTSSYKSIDFSLLESEHRKFLLRFA